MTLSEFKRIIVQEALDFHRRKQEQQQLAQKQEPSTEPSEQPSTAESSTT